MSRMMPGRVRAKGIEMYEAGKLQALESDGDDLRFLVDGEQFSYGVDGKELACTCEFFSQRQYCPHLAAVEYFVRNDPAGKTSVEEATEAVQERQALSRSIGRGQEFLERIAPLAQDMSQRYELAVEGQLMLYDDNINWQLKVRRLPDQRSYMVRDSASFLRSVKQGYAFSLGSRYYEPMTLEQFTPASQKVLVFLLGLLPDRAGFSPVESPLSGRSVRLPKGQFEAGLALFQTLPNFQVQVGTDTYEELFVEPLTAEVEQFRFEVEVQQDCLQLHIHQTYLRSFLGGTYFFREGIVYRASSLQERLIDAIERLPEESANYRLVELDLSDQNRLAATLSDLETIGRVSAPSSFVIRKGEPSFELGLTADNLLSFQLVLDFAGYIVRDKAALEELPFAVHEGQLKGLFADLTALGLGSAFQSVHALQGEDWYSLFVETIPALEALGSVTLSEELAALRVETPPRLALTSQGSLLDIAFSFEGIEEAEITEALEALLDQASHFVSKTGKVLVFDEESRRISQTLQHLRLKAKKAGHVRLNRLHAAHLAQAWQGNPQVDVAEDLRQLTADLAEPERATLPELPLFDRLRDYQLTGVKWLSTLHQYGFGGILADDMGLGKTLQTIAFLQSHVTDQSRVLILAPSSLIYNWLEEFHRFAPDMDVAVVFGSKAERESQLKIAPQIVVTSYASFRQDSDLYMEQNFDYLFLDEAQVMKNAQTKIAQTLREFEVSHCFALSGTPIENHLKEIWSIFQIVLPGLLPSKAHFGKLSAEQVARMIAPFVLRRKKEDVLEELPDRMDITTLNELTDEQKALYLAQLRQMQASLLTASDADMNARKIEILAGITRLRQICDTPSLFMEDYTGGSGKLDSLRELLVQLKDGGHRVLVFSQFRTMLDTIEVELDQLGLSSYKLTGSTPVNQRQEMTRAFNAGSRDVFLISLKAGGVGLNLTGADTVVLVDLWWNPAVEEQAISRAHRMGQDRAVECYRLITRGTIEERILALQESKRELVTTVLDGNEDRASLTVEELRDILGIS